MKTGPYPEDILVAWAAHTLQAPVKWVAERSEEFLNSVHGRDIRSELELALDDQGRILAMRLRNQGNVGAYPIQTGTAIQLMIGPWVQTSVYHVPLIDFQFQSVLTNTAPTGAYRGAGRPEAIYNMERLMDEAARQTGIDRVTLRRRNMVRPDQMPYTNAMGQTYDTGNFERIMDAGLKQADWDGFEARAAESQQRGRWRGIGLATFLEWTGGNALEENVSVNILSDGTIEVYTAVNPMGQGIATSLAQLVVDVFGVPISQVKVCMGDTDKANGFGSAGSRSPGTKRKSLRRGRWRPQQPTWCTSKARSACAAPMSPLRWVSSPPSKTGHILPCNPVPRPVVPHGPTAAMFARWSSTPTPAKSRWSSTPRSTTWDA